MHDQWEHSKLQAFDEMKNQARGFLSNDNGFGLFQALHEVAKSGEEKKHINNKKAEKNPQNEKT